MTPSMAAMVEEFALIKMAQEQYETVDQTEVGKPTNWQPINKPEFKQILKNLAIYGAGTGVGTLGGIAASEYLIPKIFPHLSPGVRRGVAVGGGALIGLLSTMAMNKNLELLRAAREANAQQRDPQGTDSTS